MLRTDIKYVEQAGNFSQAGVQAVQSVISPLASKIEGIEVQLAGSLVKQGVSQAASGGFVGFTGIPSWVRRLTFVMAGISSNGTGNYLMRIGDSAVVTSGYLGSVTTVVGATPSTSLVTIGCGLTNSVAAASVYHGVCTITNVTGNQWVFESRGSFSNAATTHSSTSTLTLTNPLTLVRLVAPGADTFDAGTVNLLWE
jgi:hypothetical protein